MIDSAIFCAVFSWVHYSNNYVSKIINKLRLFSIELIRTEHFKRRGSSEY
jgi:hypothetical protein